MGYMWLRIFLPVLLLLITAYTASAQTTRFLSGTGFFVSLYGHIITNEHVVQQCKEIYVRGPLEAKAQLIATDRKKDLALLKAEVVTNTVGYFRDPVNELTTGETLAIIGYPNNGKTTGTLISRQASFKKNSGFQGEKEWIQFSDSVANGNSGGPVLDSSGNVVGVVMAKAQLFLVNPHNGREELQDTSDIAIALPVLKEFLSRYGVRYRDRGSNSYLALHRIETLAKRYIVHVLCRQ